MLGHSQKTSSSRLGLLGALAAAAVLVLATLAPSARAEFDVTQFDGSVAANEAGDPQTQAGAHPYSATTWISFTEVPGGGLLGDLPDGNVKTIQVDLPPGFSGDPTVLPQCTEDQLAAFDARLSCPPSTQVGLVKVELADGTVGWYGLFNMVPTYGVAASFGFNFVGTLIHLNASVRTSTDYGLRVTVPNISQGLPITSTAVQMWGVPASPIHDDQRCLVPDILSDPPVCNGTTWDTMPHNSDAPLEPFLTNPADCSAGRLTTHLSANSWQDQGRWATASFDEDVNGVPMEVENCEALAFSPSVDVETTTTAPDSPTGLKVDIDLPVSAAPEGRGTPPLKDVAVVLPEGMTINPASAGGLEACTDEQLGLGSDAPVRCPLASKIGTAVAETPALDEPLEGSVYVRSQASDDPESGEMFRLALVVENEERGLSVRLPGSVVANAQTGRLETRFDDNPQLPVSKVSVRLKDGPRAPLATPSTCGAKTVDATLTSWAGQVASVSDRVTIDCPGAQGFAPRFAAGPVSLTGGAFSPFVVEIGRDDRQQFLSGISVDMPEGLLAKLRGVPLCGSGAAENGGCSAGSRIGTATVAAGAGSNPYYVRGDVFLTEGYKGGPYGLAVHVHAKAGPFDLGWVRVRQALHVDRSTAQVSAVSDPLPQIVKGVPVRLRSVDVDVDKPDFTINPTSCSPEQVESTLTSIDGAVHSTGSPLQASDCQALPFRPRLSLALTGKRQRTTGKHPGVNAVVRQAGVGEAGIDRAKVTLPKSLALDPDNAQALCEYADGTKPDLENHCPKGSIVGRARAKTPLLDRDLVGDVYFVKNVRRDAKTGNEIRTLPMIVVALRGEIAINLRGVSSTAKGGRLVNTFANVPDAPISRFNLNIKGGSNGILAVTRTRKAKINLCAKPKSHLADNQMDGHNGKRRDFDVRVKTPCAAKRSKQAERRKR